MDLTFDLATLLSVGSFVVTVYFWFVKARSERPNLEFHQLSDFRTTCRRNPDQEGQKRLWFQQLDTGGVLIVNHSSRQNSIITFDCFLQTERGEVRGDWGFTGDDKPPWNIGPESTIGFSPACIFDVPEDYDVPENLNVRIEFIAVGGKTFHHNFTRQVPRRSNAAPLQRAA